MKLSDIKPAHAEAFARFVKFCEQEKIADFEVIRSSNQVPSLLVGFNEIQIIDIETYAERILDSLKADEINDLPRQLRIFAEALETLERDKFALLNFDIHDIALCKIT